MHFEHLTNNNPLTHNMGSNDHQTAHCKTPYWACIHSHDLATVLLDCRTVDWNVPPFVFICMLHYLLWYLCYHSTHCSVAYMQQLLLVWPLPRDFTACREFTSHHSHAILRNYDGNDQLAIDTGSWLRELLTWTSINYMPTWFQFKVMFSLTLSSCNRKFLSS